MSSPIVMKYCETEQQYMVQFEDLDVIAKNLESGKYQLTVDGFAIEYRKGDEPDGSKVADEPLADEPVEDEPVEEYETKVMKPAAKKPVRSKRK